MDKEIKILASNIINYSLKVEAKDKVLITCETFNPNPLIKELVKEIALKKASVIIRYKEPTIDKIILENTTKDKVKLLGKMAKFDVENFDCFINIRCNQNDYDTKNVKASIRKAISLETEKYNDIKINKKRWVLLNFPSNIDAYKAKMPYDDFYNYSLNVMSYDYSKMKKDIKPLKELMQKTDKVRITGKDCDLTFSIKGMNIVECVGNMNIPDGEIYTAPIKKSVNGTIKFNTSSPYQGYIFEGIKLTFKDGKIIEATCDNKEVEDKLNNILDTDEGARYIGEFSLGLNPMIIHPVKDILFDEKIIGSIHLTPGRAYKDSYNGNDSAIHWDLVLIQRAEYGGGDIYFDDVLIRKDGVFVKKELWHLNK